MKLKTDISLEELTTHLENLIPGLMEDAAVPGLSIALIRRAEIAWCRGFGVRSAATGEPVTADTLFEACSLSKPLFAYLALESCRAGVLDLDIPLNSYLSEPYMPDESRASLVTARHVLSHTGGFPNWRAEGKPLAMHFTPGERFAYSGEGFVYLQRVLEQLMGPPMAEHARENLLAPLGMNHSSFVWKGDEEWEIAEGHDEEGEAVGKQVWPEMNAAASLHATAADFAHFMVAVMRPAAETDLLLGPEWSDEMLTPQVRVNDSLSWEEDWPHLRIELDERVSWGLGWGLQHHDGCDSFWHSGDNGVFRSFAAGFREKGIGLVMMANGANGAELWEEILLQGADLRGANLAGVRMNTVILEEARLRNVRFDGAAIAESAFGAVDLRGSTFRGAELKSCAMEGANLSGCDLREVDLENTNLIKADLVRANLSGARLQPTVLNEANLLEADFTGANLTFAILLRTVAVRAIFKGATFQATHARLADLSGCDFTGADARVACFERAVLTGARLEGMQASYAICEFADLRGCHLRGVDFSFANFLGAALGGSRAVDCNFFGVEFRWAELDGFGMSNCSTDEARFSQPVEVAYGPGRREAPEVEPVPLHRTAVTAEEQRVLWERGGLERD